MARILEKAFADAFVTAAGTLFCRGLVWLARIMAHAICNRPLQGPEPSTRPAKDGRNARQLAQAGASKVAISMTAHRRRSPTTAEPVSSCEEGFRLRLAFTSKRGR